MGRILKAEASPCCGPADLSSLDEVDALMKLHASFHAHAGFNGCTRRDHPGYWTAYMKTNMQDSGWVFRRVDGEGQAGEIAAFASLKTDRQTLEGFPQGYALADFFASPDEERLDGLREALLKVRRDGGREALLALVQHALASRLQCTTPSKTTPEAGPSRSEAGPSGARPAGRDGPASGGPAGGGPECAPVRFPEALVAHVEGGRANGSNPSDDWWHGAPSFAATHDDTGTMYYPLGPASRTDGPASGTDGPAAGVEGPAAGRLEPLLAGRRHVTFALDSF
ncbi:hypothetical protein T484DRAFT_1794883 [Baffinella frigidus]|nr:hypothetical protein T484DRAFT_1794883 [Cryptophyta sp. CCMP2293]